MKKCAKFVCLGLIAPALCCAGGAFAAMSGTKYGVRMLNANVAGNGSMLTDAAGRVSMLASFGQVGVQSASGARFSVNSGIINSLQPAAATLDYSYAYPNPFKKRLGHALVTFTKLTFEAEIKIFTVSGELVRTVRKASSVDSVTWDVRNEQGQDVASGLYLYIIKSGSLQKTGKLIIIK